MKVKTTDPSLPKLVMQRIEQHPDFHDVCNQVARNTSGKVYLVGGKVYRTLTELVWGKDVGADSADWDFLCVGDVAKRHRAYTLDGWNVDRQDGSYKANSMCLSYWPPAPITNQLIAAPPVYRAHHSLGGPQPHTTTGVASYTKPDKKIDIIGIKDVPKQSGSANRLEDYFAAVPLTIQAIALATDGYGPALYGQIAIQSIETKTIRVNNAKGTLRPFDVRQYARTKAQSLHFDYSHGYSTIKVPCNCFDGNISLLWNRGCQRKDIHV